MAESETKEPIVVPEDISKAATSPDVVESKPSGTPTEVHSEDAAKVVVATTESVLPKPVAPVLLPKPNLPPSQKPSATLVTGVNPVTGGASSAPTSAASGGGSTVKELLKSAADKDKKEGLETLACGAGGVDEMRKSLPDENLPYFGMLRLTLGEGTYAREKTVLVTYAPDSCAGVKKAKAAAKKNDVRKALGDVHSEWLVTQAADLSVGPMLEAVKFMAADSTKGGVSIAKMKSDYEAMVKANASVIGIGGKTKVDIKSATGRLTAAEMEKKVPSNAALKAVRDVLGPFNWALFAPTEAGKELEFVNAGSLSVNECVKWLKDDESYFGVLRMGFGEGKFRRTKWVFFTYSGPKVGVVKRSKATNCKTNMKSALGPCSVDMQATSADELALPLVIEKIKKIPGVDGACAHPPSLHFRKHLKHK